MLTEVCSVSKRRIERHSAPPRRPAVADVPHQSTAACRSSARWLAFEARRGSSVELDEVHRLQRRRRGGALCVQCGRFDTLQTSVSIADQEAVELTLPLAQTRQMGVIAKRPLANVAWRYERKPSSRTTRPTGHAFGCWTILPEVRADTAVSTALRFTLSAPGVHTAIVGTTKPDRWQRNAASLEAGALHRPNSRRSARAGARSRCVVARAGLILGMDSSGPSCSIPLRSSDNVGSTGAGQRLLILGASDPPARRVFSGSTLPTPPHGLLSLLGGRRSREGSAPLLSALRHRRLIMSAADLHVAPSSVFGPEV